MPSHESRESTRLWPARPRCAGHTWHPAQAWPRSRRAGSWRGHESALSACLPSDARGRCRPLVFRFIKIITLFHLKVEGFPFESYGLPFHLVDAFEKTMLEFVKLSDPDV